MYMKFNNRKSQKEKMNNKVKLLSVGALHNPFMPVNFCSQTVPSIASAGNWINTNKLIPLYNIGIGENLFINKTKNITFFTKIVTFFTTMRIMCKKTNSITNKKKMNVMKKSLLSTGLLLCILSFIMPAKVQAQNCPNLNFGYGNFNGWQAYKGDWKTGTPNMSLCSPTADRHVIMDASALQKSGKMQDERCAVVPKVPNGFSYSAKLGNSSVGAEMEALEYTMTIDSTNALLILHFAWVMQDPNHPAIDQPQFSMQIRDSAGKKLNFPCGNVNFVAGKNLTNLVCTGSLVARNWTTVGFNLSSLMGQKIKIYFETRDCKQTAHYGYAYIVGECQPFAIDFVFCEGQVNATLTAPKGFVEYIWTRSSQPSWELRGANMQQITVTDAEEGETYMCTVISELDNCSAFLTATITKTYINAGMALTAYDTCTRTATFADTSSVRNGKRAARSWEIPALNVFSTDSLFTYKFPDLPNAVDYLVRLTVITANGCEDTVQQTIRIYPSPQIKINGVNQLCGGDTSYIKAVALRSQFVNHQWTWNGNPIATGVDSVKAYSQGTYKVVSTNTENCITSDSINVTIFPIPYINLVSKTMEHCEGNNGSVEVGHNNTASPINFIWNTGATTNRLNNLTAGTYKVTMTDGNGCKADTSIVIDLYNMPTHSVTSTDETCYKENGTITLTVNSDKPNTVKYIWAGLRDTTASLTGLEAGMYYVTIKDSLCTIKDSIKIKHIDIPTSTFATSSYDICTRTATFADLSSVKNGDKNAIVWEIPDLNITSSDSLFTHTFPDPTTNQSVVYMARLTVVAGNGCVDTTEQYITIYSSPEVKIDSTTMLCGGDSTYLKATAIKSQIKDYQWTWKDEYGATKTSNVNPLKVYKEGIYTLTATNVENCKAYDTIQVVSAPIPYITVVGSDWETCNSGNGFIEISAVNAVNPVKFTWNTGNAQDTTHQLSMLKAGTYKVNMVDGNGCKADTSIVVSLYPTPTAAIYTDPEECKGRNGEIRMRVTSAKPSTLTYTWDGLPYKTPSLSGLRAGTYRVTIQDTLCTIDTTIVIETIDGLDVSFGIQSYDTCTRTATFVDASTIVNGIITSTVWEIADLEVTFTGNSFTYTFPDPTTDQPVPYKVRLAVTTQNNCVQRSEQTITVYPSPEVKIDGKNFLCVGDSIYLQATPIKSKFNNHIWTWEDKNEVTHTATGSSLKVYREGVYHLTSYNSENCPAFDTKTVQEAPQPVIENASTTLETCDKGNGSIQINTINAAEPVKYIWSTGRKQDTTSKVNQLDAGKYSVKIIDGNGCTADTSVVVNFYPLPVIVNIEKTPERCYKEDGTIDLIVSSASPETLIYQWVAFPHITSPNLKNLKAGIYEVTIIDSLCSIDTTIVIETTEPPVADFEVSTFHGAIHKPITVTDKSFGNVVAWNWDMGDETTKTGKVATHSYSESGDYKIILEIIDDNGCTDTTSKIIHIHKLEVYIPNMFTPNGDGINDAWKPVMREYSRDGYKLSIFDRWGQVIFLTTDTEASWDGTVNGNPAAPNTVYAYQLTVRDYLGLEYEFTGHISLIK